MSRYLKILIFSALVIAFSCKKKPSASETDNLFKFKDYISSHTHGLQSISSSVSILLAQQLDQFELNQELPGEYLQISPKIEGQLVIDNGREITFHPSEYLKPDTEYVVRLKLNKLFGDIDSEFKQYTFSFKTIAPNFSINLRNLQSYSKEWQYLTGTLDASDLLETSRAKSILQVKQGERQLKVKWDEADENARYFSFKIDSISRKKEDSELLIRWEGNALGIDNQGEEKFTVPGLDKFVVVDAKTASAPNPSLTINFSEPLQQNQNLDGLVTIENAKILLVG
ncbi:MAG: hypothetical protein AAGJ12_05140 [Bacteroidota bacterium]